MSHSRRPSPPTRRRFGGGFAVLAWCFAASAITAVARRCQLFVVGYSLHTPRRLCTADVAARPKRGGGTAVGAATSTAPPFPGAGRRESTDPPSGSAFRRDPERFAEDAQALLREIGEIAVKTGWRAGVRRTIQATRAVAQTSAELLREIDVRSLLREGQAPEDAVVARSLRRLFERLGATYVKLGQFIASTPTIFPAAYVREFANTLDQTERVPFAKIQKIVEEDMGKPLTQVFRSFEKTPLASASIAQVHAATLLSGEDVVVKVQKPGIEDVLQADLGFLYATARVLQFLAPELGRSSLAEIVGDIRQSMLGELDFRQEKDNLVRFRAFLEENGLSGIATAPKPYPEASSKRVLTMERFRGVPLVDLEGIKAYSSNPEQTLIDALNVWALSVQYNDFFHADVHSGNLLVLTDGRVGFIDFGIVGRIPPAIWKAVSALSTSFVQGDTQGMARALISMGATSGSVDEARFAEGISLVLQRMGSLQPEVRVRGGPDGEVSAQVAFDESEVTDIALELVRVAEENGLKLPREFGLLLKQVLYFDRYNKILAPELDPLRDPRVRVATSARDDAIDV